MQHMELQTADDEQNGQHAFSGSPEREKDARARIEHQIEALLATEEDVTVLHNRLFSQTGLFHQLAPTVAERQQQKESPLYRRAKAVVNQLMLDVEAGFRKSISEAN